MLLACLKLIIASEGHSFTNEQHSYYPTDGYYLPDQMNFETNPQVSTNIPSHIYSMNPTQELSYVNTGPIYLLPVHTTLVPVYVPVIQIIQGETDPNLQPQSFLSVNANDTSTDLAHVSSINEVESSLQTLNLGLNTENEEMKKSDTQRFLEGSNLCASCSSTIKDDAEKSKTEAYVIKINKNETSENLELKKTKEGKTSKKRKSHKGEVKICGNKNEQSSIKMESIQPDTEQTINYKEEAEWKVVKRGGKVETLTILDKDDIKFENKEEENIRPSGPEEKSDQSEQTIKKTRGKTQNKKSKKSKKSSKRHKEIKTEDDELLNAYIAENSFSINLTPKIINSNAFIDGIKNNKKQIKILVNPYTKIEVSGNVKDLGLYGEIVIKSKEEIFNQEYILTFVSIFELMLDGFSHIKLQDKLKFVVIILNFVFQNNMNNIKGDLIKFFYLALQHHKDDFESLQNFSFIANLYVKSFVVHRTGCNPSSKCNCNNDIKIINYQFLAEKLTPDWFAEYQNVYKKNKLNKLTDIKKISALVREIIKELEDIKECQIKKYFCSQKIQFEKINIIVKEQRISFDRYVDYIDTNLNK